MPRLRSASALLSACLTAWSGGAQCRVGQHRITVADTIRMTELSRPEPEAGGHPEEIASFSPDASHFAVVVKSGHLENNTNVFLLRVYATARAFATQKPEATLTMASNSNRPAIADLRWLRNGHTLLFLGEEPDRSAQIYSYDLVSRRLRRLTSHPTSVVRYDTSDDGGVIVFEAEPPPEDIVDSPATRRSGFVLRGEELSTVLFSGYHSAQSMAFHSRQLFIMIGKGKPREVPTGDGIWPFLTLSVSPDGRYALLGALMQQVPDVWMGYQEHVLHEFIAARRQPGTVSEVQSYLLLDTKTASLRPLLNAPKDWPDDGYLWIDGGRSLVVSHTYLPLAGESDEERQLRQRQAFVAEVALPSGRFVLIGEEDLSATRWDAAKHEITLTGRGKNTSVRKVYRRTLEGWKQVADHDPDAPVLPTVTLVEGMNAAPTLWLSSPGTGRRVRLLDLNPQFADLCFGHEEEISWKAADGHPVIGGLYLPPDYVPGRRYPLVIQTHGFEPHEFWIDGPWHGAFAAQPLAAEDIVVLQMNYDRVGVHTPEEAPRAMAAIDGAIDALGDRGIIDPNRVGLIGFSRTVFHVAYTLTHSTHHFAAATLADGLDGSFFQAVAFPATAGADAAAVNGGPPYGASLRQWLERSPLFNVASITAPIRLESHGMDSVLGLWGWYSLLTERGMPVDMIVLPHAPHELLKPWDRRVSQQGDVDWFCFWLEEKLPPANELRWESLHSMRTSDTHLNQEVENRTQRRAKASSLRPRIASKRRADERLCWGSCS